MLIAPGLCLLMAMNAAFGTIDQVSYVAKAFLAATHQRIENQTARGSDLQQFRASKSTIKKQ